MKVLLVLIIVFYCGTCYGADYTYEKVSSTVMKITETDTVKTSDNVTILSLKEQKAGLEAQKETALNNYNASISALNSEVDLINTRIAEAVKLGVTEAVVEPITE